MTEPLDSEETRIFEGPRARPVQDLLRAPGDLQSFEQPHGGALAALAMTSLPAPKSANVATRSLVLPVPAATGSRMQVAAKTQSPIRPPATLPPSSPLFRQEAMRAYSQGLALAAPLQVAPLATRALFMALLGIVISALSVAALGHVELTSIGRGVLRAREGVQPVASPIPGLVSEVLVEGGGQVAPGQVLVRIDSTQLRAQLLDAERKLGAVVARHAQESESAERLYRLSVSKLRKRRALIERRVRSQQRGVARLNQRSERFRELADQGLSDLGTLEDAHQALDEAERASLSLQDQLALADVELSRLARDLEGGRSLRREELERATSERDAVFVLIEQTELRASRTGRIEGMRVTAGQQVQPGALLMRLVPVGRPRDVVAFMPERDRAFLVEGREVRLELDRLPVGEFGSLGARVTRISNDVATAEELALHLGEDVKGTYFRVDLTLTDDAAQARLESYLQSGSLMTIRAPLRSRRILSLIFDPIRRLLD